jgi:hypothetical protein
VDLAALLAYDDQLRAHVPTRLPARVVCAAWVRFHAGTGFATLWGGPTLPAWRGRGL